MLIKQDQFGLVWYGLVWIGMVRYGHFITHFWHGLDNIKRTDGNSPLKLILRLRFSQYQRYDLLSLGIL